MIILWNKQKGTGGSGGGGSSFPTIVKNSGSSLPVDLSGYYLNDTFLHTSAMKIYKASEGYELDTNVTSTVDNVDLFTGVATGFGYNKDVIKTSSDFLWSGNTEMKVHFKQSSVPTSGKRSIFYSLTTDGTDKRYACVFLNKKQLHFGLLFYNTQEGRVVAYKDTQIISSISSNTEYYVKITKTGTTGKAELFTEGFDSTPIASVDFETEDYVVSGQTTSTLQFMCGANGFFMTENTYLTAYLLDCTGDFLVPSTNLVWDSGEYLTDNTEYFDRTNRILYLYLGGYTLLQMSGVPASTVLTDQTSTSMALKRNTIYKWTTALTSLSFASVEVSDLETVLYFTTGGTISFTDSSSLKWGGDGSAPTTLEPNTRYCISIRNGLAEIDTFGTVS